MEIFFVKSEFLIHIATLIFNEKFKLNCIDELRVDYKNPIYQCRKMNQVSFLDYPEIFEIFS